MQFDIRAAVTISQTPDNSIRVEGVASYRVTAPSEERAIEALRSSVYHHSGGSFRIVSITEVE